MAMVVPEWAGFFNDISYNLFMSEIHREFTRRRLDYEIDGSGVKVTDGTGGTERLGLTDLARKCHASGKENWHTIILDHFESLSNSGRELKNLEHCDPESVIPLLKVRLYPPGLMEKMNSINTISRRLSPCLFKVLVFDLPSAVVTAGRERTERLRLDDDDLFKIARDNLSGELVEPEKVEINENTFLDIYNGNSHFVASLSLLLDRMYDSPWGCLAGLPSRHTMLIHEIHETSGHIQATATMIHEIERIWNEEPGSISPHLFWIRDDGFHQFMTGTGDNGPYIIPPEAFLREVLTPLSDSEETE